VAETVQNEKSMTYESPEPQQDERVLQEQQGTEHTSHSGRGEIQVSAFTDDETEHHS